MSSWNANDNKHLRYRDREFFAPSEPYEVDALRTYLLGRFPKKPDEQIRKAIKFVGDKMKAPISQDHARVVADMVLAMGQFAALDYLSQSNLAK